MTRGTPRWWKKLLGVLIALAVLAGAGELALRLIVPGVIENAVRSQLKLSGDHPVDVSLGGSALLNALRGGIGDVRVAVPEAPIRDGIVADAELAAGLVPFNPLNGEIRDGDVRVTVPQDQLGPFVSLLTKGVATTGEVRDGNVVIGRSISVLGQDIPLTISLSVGVVDGDILLEPQRVSAAGLDLTAEQITEATGTLLDPVLHPEPVCVRDQLPAGVTITEVTLSSTGSAIIDASLAPGIVSDPAQRAKGSCE
ncbi:DUF2993 domain-containing protein [Leucobacter chromiireducens]|uniref:DUF2993 domain-containing protein n=1 Tax=Leucobacter chromiireducens subsp. solipictus TaxID=398235 RepID=A0ABS1SH98_9MICO|nr:DUF2993 domain-containing protein [Leucobacter chromiireducens]MBL3679905.1 DUF2993 domain-containing protein [Leucobacter chromiireducens subsp. solipictus]